MSLVGRRISLFWIVHGQTRMSTSLQLLVHHTRWASPSVASLSVLRTTTRFLAGYHLSKRRFARAAPFPTKTISWRKIQHPSVFCIDATPFPPSLPLLIRERAKARRSVPVLTTPNSLKLLDTIAINYRATSNLLGRQIEREPAPFR
jgi:hypothetical protein